MDIIFIYFIFVVVFLFFFGLVNIIMNIFESVFRKYYIYMYVNSWKRSSSFFSPKLVSRLDISFIIFVMFLTTSILFSIPIQKLITPTNFINNFIHSTILYIYRIYAHIYIVFINKNIPISDFCFCSLCLIIIIGFLFSVEKYQTNII